MKFSLSKLYNSRYTALTALGIRQEVKHIMTNVFYSTFLNVFFILATFFTFFSVFFIFPKTFFTPMVVVVVVVVVLVGQRIF